MPRRGWSPPREIEPNALVRVPWCGSYEVADSRRKSSATLQARTQHGEVTDEGDCGDGSGCGNGRDEVSGAARATGGVACQPLGGELRRCRCSGSCVGIHREWAVVA